VQPATALQALCQVTSPWQNTRVCCVWCVLCSPWPTRRVFGSSVLRSFADKTHVFHWQFTCYWQQRSWKSSWILKKKVFHRPHSFTTCFEYLRVKQVWEGTCCVWCAQCRWNCKPVWTGLKKLLVQVHCSDVSHFKGSIQVCKMMLLGSQGSNRLSLYLSGVVSEEGITEATSKRSCSGTQ
jgi:hypothetical protein